MYMYRIEALMMRSQKKFLISESAVKVKIQDMNMVRGNMNIDRKRHVSMQSESASTIVKKIQSSARIFIWLARKTMTSGRLDMHRACMATAIASMIIQRALKSFLYRKESTRSFSSLSSKAATVIQARVRGINCRKQYYTTLYEYGIDRLQALYRGRGARARYHLMKIKKEEEARADASKKVVMKSSSPVKKMEVDPEGATATATATAKDLYNYIQEQDWANVQQALNKNHVFAETVEPLSGELPLHAIARHHADADGGGVGAAWTETLLVVKMVLDLNPKALKHRDKMGALPIHHAAAAAAARDNLSVLEIIFNEYREGIHKVDGKGRLPLHIAAEFDAVNAVKFLLSNSSEGAFTMVYRPMTMDGSPGGGGGGGLPLHVACRNGASIGVITALLRVGGENNENENFAFTSAKRTDENGDLPLHLLLKCGQRVGVVDQEVVVVKTLLTCFPSAAARTDMNGDLPLSLAIKNRCQPGVIHQILLQYPYAASTRNSNGESPLHLALKYGCDDRTILELLNHAPEFATLVDKKTGLLPIQVATQHEHSHFIVHNLLKRDMPLDLEEKVRVQLLPHHYSWNHIVANTRDLYHPVVTKILQQCTQPQVLALAHVEGPDGRIAMASATTVCKHELRVMLRLFNTLELVNHHRPAYTNPMSDTRIFYALRYDPPSTKRMQTSESAAFTMFRKEKKDQALGDYVEDLDHDDDASTTSTVSVVSHHSLSHSLRSNLLSRCQDSVVEKLRQIKKEKGQQVIAKLTSRSDVVERELKVRKDYHLSRHYVPAIISVHHTALHAAYSEAMAEPGYCITMEGADTTAENLLLDMRRAGKTFPVKALKKIGISLHHMHEHNLVHCDFGTHNIGKFGRRWKILGIGGSVPIGKPTNPNRGFYHPPESIVVETKNAAIGKKAVTATVVSVPARPSYDIWAYGIVLYEVIAGTPLSACTCGGKRTMLSSEVAKKIGQWDEHRLKKAIRHLPPEIDENAKSLIKSLLHYNPELRFNSMKQVLDHPFFTSSSSTRNGTHTSNADQQSRDGCVALPQAVATQSMSMSSNPSSNSVISPTTSRSKSCRNWGSQFSPMLGSCAMRTIDEERDDISPHHTQRVERQGERREGSPKQPYLVRV